MRTIIGILFCALLISPMCIFAQNSAGQKQEHIRIMWDDLNEYAEWVSYNVPISYDDDDNEIKHGPFKINYKKNLSAQLGQKCIIGYSASGNYVNGKLEGPFTIEETITVDYGTVKTKGTLNYANGVPTGTLTFLKSATHGNKSETQKCSVTIKDKKLINYNDGETNFNINDDGTFSGTVKGEVYKNSINTNTLYLKTGKAIKPDSTAQSLINACVAGTMSNSDLIAKGFTLVKRRWITNGDFSKLQDYISVLGIHEFDDLVLHNIIGDRVSATAISDLENSFSYDLMRVNVMSVEELIEKASTIKEADEVYTESQRISWCDANNIKYIYEFNTNSLYFSDKIYYFTDESKQKLEEIIKVSLEERRLEQERIAEEKLKREIQPICDYLVSQRSQSSIAYSEEATRYFDTTGLSEYWRLDLSKKIKPFCKIEDCKVFSCETKEDAVVAVLDITKYDKKGNITYRVPVTIKYGKILVTSIDFSNATVVE